MVTGTASTDCIVMDLYAGCVRVIVFASCFVPTLFTQTFWLRAAGGGRELNWILFLTLARLGRRIAEGILQQCAADFIACVSQILFVGGIIRFVIVVEGPRLCACILVVLIIITGVILTRWDESLCDQRRKIGVDNGEQEQREGPHLLVREPKQSKCGPSSVTCILS